MRGFCFSPHLLTPLSPDLSLSDGADLLPHENVVTDPETNKGDRYDRYDIGSHDQNALKQRKGILEPAQRDPLERSHQDESQGVGGILRGSRIVKVASL